MKKTAQFLASIFALGLVACSDGNKTAGGVSIEENTVAEGISSSSVQSVSSSSVQQGISSAKLPEEIMSSSLVSVIVTPVPSNDEVKPVVLWDGASGNYKVDTGNDNSGSWFVWRDDEEGGTSTIDFPVAMGNEYSGDSYDANIEYCGGFCGSVEFGTTIPNPSVGAAFSVAVEGETADISEWHGLCVAYSSELLFDIYLVSELGDEADVVVSRVEIPRAADSTMCVSWKDFAVEGSAVENAAEAAKTARIVGFEFKGEPGEKGFFNIKSITTFNESLRPLSGSN